MTHDSRTKVDQKFGVWVFKIQFDWTSPKEEWMNEIWNLFMDRKGWRKCGDKIDYRLKTWIDSCKQENLEVYLLGTPEKGLRDHLPFPLL